MQVTETSAEGLKREYTVVVPATDIESKLVTRLNQIGSSVKIPGFRPGKAPMALLKKRYGNAVKGEVLEQTLQDSWQKTIEDKGLRPAGQPRIEIVKFEDGADLEYKLAVELLPEIKAVEFSKIEVERRVSKASDEQVNEALQRMAEQRRTFATEEGREASTGDVVVIDFNGTVDGEPFSGGQVNDFQLELGAGMFLPGFDEQIVGARASESRAVTVKMGDDHPNDALRGKEVAFDVSVKEVKAPKAVAVDDAMAQAAGVENLEALKKLVREQIDREHSQVSRAFLKRALLDRLADLADFALPGGIVDQEFETIWNQVTEAREKGQLDEDDKDKSEDELKARYREIAERRVRLGLLLSEIGRVNNIRVSQDDVNRAMSQEAARFPGQEAKIYEYFQKNPQAAQELQAPIFEEKVVDFIIEMVKVTEREVSVEELYRDPDEEKPAAEEKPVTKGRSHAKTSAKK
jgi:trigger factor